jgi:monoterpene epsilon-lactone hydrolase
LTHPGIEMIAGIIADSGVMKGTVLERRAAMAASAAGSPAPAGVQVETTELGGRPAEWLVPDGADRDRAVLYLHGGGYCLGSLDTHRDLAGRIALASGIALISLDYRLAPEHPFPAAVDDALAAYVGLLEAGLTPGRVAIAGDSAGGGLTVVTLVSIRDSGLPMPAAAVCLSPWVDLTQSSPSCLDPDLRDPLLSAEDLQLLAGSYLGDTDPRSVLASPLFAQDLSGLPPMLIEAGEDEPLLDDAASLAGRVGAAGAEVTLNIWPDLVHVFQAFPPEIVPEAGESIAGIGEFLARHVGRSAT